jgi:hypothetical protein
MTGRSVCFGLFSLSYLRLECDVDYAYNAPSADSMRNRRGNCFEKNLIFLPTGVRCVTSGGDDSSDTDYLYRVQRWSESIKPAIVNAIMQ